MANTAAGVATDSTDDSPAAWGNSSWSCEGTGLVKIPAVLISAANGLRLATALSLSLATQNVRSAASGTL